MKLNAVLCSLFRREERCCSVQTLLIQICHDNHGRTDVSVKRVGQCTKSHRACSCHNRKLSALFDSHLVCIYAHLRMISSIKCSDTAGHRLCQRCFIVGTSLVFQKASQLHYLRRNDTVCCISSEEFVRISRAPHCSLIVQSRLKSKFHSRFELVLMVLSYLYDISRELMSHDCRMLCYILMHTFVFGSKNSTFVCRHTDTV